MGKATLLTCISLLMLGCDGGGVTVYVDRNAYKEAYLACLAAMPKQPSQTNYSDLDEAMEECDGFAIKVATQMANCDSCTPRRVARQ